MSRQRVSIEDIARELDVAPSTVSRALNGKPGVGAMLRNRILEKANSVGYNARRNEEERSDQKRNIAMIIGDIRNPFYADLVFVVQKALSSEGYMVSVFSSEYNEEQELGYLQMVEHFKFAGVIDVCVSSERISKALQNLSIPIVMVNRMLPSLDADVVLLDNYVAGYLATQHLLERGHTRIGFLMGQQNSSSSMQRYEGYLQMMRNYQIPVIKEYQLNGDLTLETGFSVAEKAFSKWKEPPTAMVISNDLAAFGFLSYCGQAGIRIPENLSLVSFDNTILSAALVPPLTSVDPHVEEMGRKAAELMLLRIGSPKEAKRRIILNPTLIERGSVRYL